MFQSPKKNIKKWGVLLPWRVSPRYQHVIYASGGFSVRAPERGYLPGNPRVPAMEVVFRLHFWRVSSCQFMSLASLDESAGTKTHIRPMWESQSYRHKPYQVARTLPFWRHHKPHMAMVTSSDASFCGTSRDSPWPLGYGGVNWQGAMWKAHGKFCSDNEWSTSGGLSTSNS